MIRRILLVAINSINFTFFCFVQGFLEFLIRGTFPQPPTIQIFSTAVPATIIRRLLASLWKRGRPRC